MKEEKEPNVSPRPSITLVAKTPTPTRPWLTKFCPPKLTVLETVGAVESRKGVP